MYGEADNIRKALIHLEDLVDEMLKQTQRWEDWDDRTQDLTEHKVT